MNTAHTPGPWKINGYAYQRDGSAPTGRRLIRVNPESTAAEGMTVDSQNGQVCEIRRVRGLSDARLIASAPARVVLGTANPWLVIWGVVVAAIVVQNPIAKKKRSVKK